MPWIEARYSGQCSECESELFAGDRIYYNGRAYCEDCGQDAADEDEDDDEG